MLGGRLSQRRDVTPHEPMWIQLLGSVLTIEGPRRHVLWIYVDANALRLTSLEPSRQGTQEFTCHARSPPLDRKSTRLNSSHVSISYAVFCSKKNKNDSISRLHG